MVCRVEREDSMIRFTRLFLAAAIGISAVSNLLAADIFWIGGTGNYLDANYSDGTNTGLTPAGGDVVHIGAAGIVTYVGDGNNRGVGKLRVGHNQTTPGGTGQG